MEQNTLRRRGTGLIGIDPELSWPGYTLYAPLASRGVVELVDAQGEPVHRWSLPYRPGRHARLLADGTLAYNGATLAIEPPFAMWRKYSGGSMGKYDPNGVLLSEFRDDYQHHDAHHYDDGRILYTAVEPLTGAAARRIEGGVAGTEADGVVWADVIREVAADGTPLWEWRAFEQLDPAEFGLQPHYWREHWPLINSVHPLDEHTVVASLRSVSAVITIDRRTGRYTTLADRTTVAQQHHATPVGDGKILIFDNGTFRTGESVPYSRVIEIDARTGELVWTYQDSPREAFFTPFMGAAQRLPNGNTLITEAAFGRIFEVTPTLRTCWEYIVPSFPTYPDPTTAKLFPAPSNAIFRAYRYTPPEIPWLNPR
ncbi:aryl-sulfate sulfotransferase [Nocardia transvalensis]|uniref:aryl-sulfate sulfotransferase n=1 Tax=Nocardia transvalensis TaxID=37333 RepID=UPI001893BD64|nr:aryl-sulfate sulfotransferase [Nocardia transvalensis]MBF6327072.1 aryl-sulfate sulfotransferase [Nocardia transvalensis]